MSCPTRPESSLLVVRMKGRAVEGARVVGVGGIAPREDVVQEPVRPAANLFHTEWHFLALVLP